MLFIRPSLAGLIFLISLLAQSFAQRITGCPGTEITYTAANLKTYQICRQSDYGVTTLRTVPNIADNSACADLCSTTTDCTKAVYDTINKFCHIKATPTELGWRKSQQYDTVRFVNTPPQRASNTKCPYPEWLESTPSSNSHGFVCLGTDYHGYSARIVPNVADEAACTRECDQASACKQAVYYKPGLACHLKGSQAQWVIDSNFNSIRMQSKAQGVPDRMAIGAACPFKETEANIDGAVSGICPGTDFARDTTYIQYDVPDATACARICKEREGCTRAVYGRDRICHVKAKTDDSRWFTDLRYNTIRFRSQSDTGNNGNNGNLQPNNNPGKWGDIIRLPMIPVGAYVVPEQPQSSRLLVYSSWAPNNFGGATGQTQFADYNFRTGTVSQRTITNTEHDMFCPGMSYLEDGRMVITGGSDAEAVSIYNPATNQFTRAPDVKIARG